MAETVLLQEQNIDGFALDSSLGGYAKGIPAQFELVTGQTYKVVWDETVHNCTAYNFSMNGFAGVGLGNEGLISGATAEIVEPFVVAYVETTNYISFVAMDGSTAATHKVGIYQVVEEVGIVLKDNNGEDQVYYSSKVRLNKSDGSKSIFSEGEAVENIPIALDFSAGNQVITAPAGTLVKSAVIQKPDTLVPENVAKGVEVAGIVGELAAETEEVTVALSMADGNQVITPTTEDKAMSKVTVQKPETLIPENIAEGVDIAGIVGTLAAGGGSDVLGKRGTFTGNGGAYTLTHGLGVVPDVFVACLTNVYNTSTRDSSSIFFGVSRAIKDKYGINVSQFANYYGGTNITVEKTTLYGIDEKGSTRSIYNATDKQITLGSSYVKTLSGKTYEWLAIGGLT